MRPDWDQYFLDIAKAVAARADCRRRRVGAVLTEGNRIVGTGYNGAPSGSSLSCVNGQCPRGLMTNASVKPGSQYESGFGRCIAVHAEANALLHSVTVLRGGLAGTMYVTTEPCLDCMKLMAAAGLWKVVWDGSPIPAIGETRSIHSLEMHLWLAKAK